MTAKMYERKKDAKFVATGVKKTIKEEIKIQKVRIIDEQIARGFSTSICPDLGIASHSPKQGETGWIVVRGDPRQAYKRYKTTLEFLLE